MVDGVGVMVKEELCQKVLEVRIHLVGIQGNNVEVEVGIRVCATQWVFWPSMELTHTGIQ